MSLQLCVTFAGRPLYQEPRRLVGFEELADTCSVQTSPMLVSNQCCWCTCCFPGCWWDKSAGEYRVYCAGTALPVHLQSSSTFGLVTISRGIKSGQREGGKQGDSIPPPQWEAGGRLVLSCLFLASSWAPPVALLTLLSAAILLRGTSRSPHVQAGVGAGAAFLHSGHLSHCQIMCRRSLVGAVLEVCTVCSCLRSCVHSATSQPLGRRGDLRPQAPGSRSVRSSGDRNASRGSQGSSPSHGRPDVKFGVIFLFSLHWRQHV